jgi:chromosome segregation protein
VELEIAERELHRAQSLATTAQRAFDLARSGERSALEELESVEAELAGFVEALAVIQRSRSATDAEIARLRARMAAIDESDATRGERIASLRARVAEFEGEEAERQTAWEALNKRRSEVASRRDDARRAVERAAAERASQAERRRLSEARIDAIDAEMAQLVLIPRSHESIDELVRIEQAATTAIASVGAKIDVLRDRQRSLRDQMGTANADLRAAEDSRERLERQRNEASEALNALDVELAELRVRLEASTEALRRDADAEEAEALAAPLPELDEGQDPAERLASLLADLKRMGPINPLAAEEYATLSAEVEELDRQLADLAESKAELKKVISALDARMVALFEGAFEEIAAHYHENFSLVFPGGSGRLRLTEEGDAMGAGVLVEAQPAGKKVGRLSLLSGGERSLAALAFLFAVFRARPSPFYVLDEVEAALDDANLHRFLRLVDTLRAGTQLVIITHQQQTMEAADVLYGVTMEPGESTKVLSKRMGPVAV